MQVEIITIGDEILIGQVVDTNSAWMAQQLNLIGAKVDRIVSISDAHSEIVSAIEVAETRADVILITGGLGPTKDDITKKALADHFKCGFTFHAEIATHIERLFARFGKPLTALNRLQAELPSACTPLQNDLGTAPGMWFERSGRVIVSMPGVPYEMKGIMSAHVLTKIKSRFQMPTILHRTILTIGMGESWLSEKIASWEDALPEHIRLAYLPSPGRVRLRLSAYGQNEALLRAELAQQEHLLLALIPEIVYGFDDDTLETVVGNQLRNMGCTVSTAESCTGGMVAHLITSVSGSSDYYLGSVVSYSNEVKMNMLGVNEDSLMIAGAVSEEVVKRMAESVRVLLKTDYAISTSGIAGPTGGTEEKAVGTVWIAVAGPNGTSAKRFQFGHVRERNIEISALTALNMLRKMLLQDAQGSL